MNSSLEERNGEETTMRRNILETGFDSDVTIHGKDGIVPGHKLILRENAALKAELEQPGKTSSPVAGCSQSNGNKTLSMGKWTMEEIREFMSFVYLGETPKAVKNPSLAITLHDMGVEYDDPILMLNMCKILMEMSIDQFFKEDAAGLIKIATAGGSLNQVLEQKAAEVDRSGVEKNVIMNWGCTDHRPRGFRNRRFDSFDYSAISVRVVPNPNKNGDEKSGDDRNERQETMETNWDDEPNQGAKVEMDEGTDNESWIDQKGRQEPDYEWDDDEPNQGTKEEVAEGTDENDKANENADKLKEGSE